MIQLGNMYFQILKALTQEGYPLQKAEDHSRMFVNWKTHVGGKDRAKSDAARKLMSKVLPLTVEGKALHFLHPLYGKPESSVTVWRGHGEKDTHSTISTSRNQGVAEQFGYRLSSFVVDKKTPAVALDRALSHKNIDTKYRMEAEVVLSVTSHAAKGRVTRRMTDAGWKVHTEEKATAASLKHAKEEVRRLKAKVMSAKAFSPKGYDYRKSLVYGHAVDKLKEAQGHLAHQQTQLKPKKAITKVKVKPMAKTKGARGSGGSGGKGGGWRTVKGRKLYIGSDGKAYVGAAAGKQYAKEKK